MEKTDGKLLIDMGKALDEERETMASMAIRIHAASRILAKHTCDLIAAGEVSAEEACLALGGVNVALSRSTTRSS